MPSAVQRAFVPYMGNLFLIRRFICRFGKAVPIVILIDNGHSEHLIPHTAGGGFKLNGRMRCKVVPVCILLQASKHRTVFHVMAEQDQVIAIAVVTVQNKAARNAVCQINFSILCDKDHFQVLMLPPILYGSFRSHHI